MSSIGDSSKGVGDHYPTTRGSSPTSPSNDRRTSAVASTPIAAHGTRAASTASGASQPLGRSHSVTTLAGEATTAGRTASAVAEVAQTVLPIASQNGTALIKKFYQARLEQNPQSIQTMRSIVEGVRIAPTLLQDQKYLDGTPLTIQNLEDMVRSKTIMFIVHGRLGSVAEGLTAQIEAIPVLVPSSEQTVQNRAQAKEVMAQWHTAVRNNEFKSIQTMERIIGIFSQFPDLLQSLTIADGKPLDLQTLKDQYLVKQIDLILQGKVSQKGASDARDLVAQIKSPERKEQANQIINASPLVRDVLRSSPQVIRNPENNCFMDAALVSLLDNPQNYDYIHNAIVTIAGSNNPSNPTIEGADASLVEACREHPLDSDYTKWEIGDNGKKITTFLRMTLGDAAKCAQALIEKWHDGYELNQDESTLLRLVLSKLSNIPYNTSDEGEFPHINSPTVSSILPGSQEDSQQFTMALLNGLNELTPTLAPANPFRILDGLRSKYDRTHGIHPIETRLYQGEGVDSSKGPDINNLRAALTERKPVLNMLYAKPEGSREANFTLLRSLMEDEKGYQLDSIVLRMSKGSTYSGHYVTLKQVRVNGESVWLSYDDIATPHVKALSADKVEEILRGEVSGFTPLSFVFSDSHRTSISGELTQALARVAPRASFSPAQFTSVDGELKQRCRALISEGKLDIAIKVATRLKNPMERRAALLDIQKIAYSQLTFPQGYLEQLIRIRDSVQQEIDNASQQLSTPQKIWVAFGKLFSCFSAPKAKPPNLLGHVTMAAAGPQGEEIRQPLLRQGTGGDKVLVRGLSGGTYEPPQQTITQVATQALYPSVAPLPSDIDNAITKGDVFKALKLVLAMPDSSEKLGFLRSLPAKAKGKCSSPETYDRFCSSVASALRRLQTEQTPTGLRSSSASQSPAPRGSDSTRISSVSGRASSGSGLEGISMGGTFDPFDGFASRPKEISLKNMIEGALNDNTLGGGAIAAVALLELYVRQDNLLPTKEKKLTPEQINAACLRIGLQVCTDGDPDQASIARRSLKLMTDGQDKTKLELKMLENGWSLTSPPSLPPSSRSEGTSSAVSQRPRAGMGDRVVIPIDPFGVSDPETLSRIGGAALRAPPPIQGMRGHSVTSIDPFAPVAASSRTPKLEVTDANIEGQLLEVIKRDSKSLSPTFELIQSMKASTGVSRELLNKAYFLTGLAAIKESKIEDAKKALGLMYSGLQKSELSTYIEELKRRTNSEVVLMQIYQRGSIMPGPFLDYLMGK